MAQFERDLLIERTLAGQSRARSEGKKFGRPRALTEKQRECVAQKLANGATVSELARQLKSAGRRSCALGARERQHDQLASAHRVARAEKAPSLPTRARRRLPAIPVF